MDTFVKIRKFSSDDIYDVIELLQDVSKYRPKASDIPALAEAFHTQKYCHAYVAFFDNRIIGFGSLFILNRVRGGKSGVIEDMAVSTEVRGKGIGRKIMDALLHEARSLGCFKVSLETSPAAKSFYASVGFSSAGQTMSILLQKHE